MEMVLLIGIQASGKSTFYQYQFFRTHLRINPEMLRSRTRETALIDACLAVKQSFVVDNTNVTRESRGEYIDKAKAAGFKVIGYFFDTPLEDALKRNRRRPEDQQVPDAAIYAMKNRLEMPSKMEGFN